MTFDKLERANELVEEANAINDLQILLRNAASTDGAELRACRDTKILNRCTLRTEIAEKLVEALQAEKVRLNDEFEKL